MDGITDSMDVNLSKFWEITKCRDAQGSLSLVQRAGHGWAAE